MIEVTGNLGDPRGDAALHHGSRRMIEILPGINVLEDPDLTALAEDVRSKLMGYDVKDLRKNPQVRSQAAKEAQEIMERMQGFMSAFGVQ